MDKIDCDNITKEEDNIMNNKENKEILILKKSLLLKDQLISKLQKELEFNTLKNNLDIQQPFVLNKNKDSINILKKYDSYKNIKETLSNRTNSTNKNIILEDIQKQIFELNIELRTKKNLLSKKQNEIKSNTCTNWNVNQNNKSIEELKEMIEKNEEENMELKNIINIKEKKISKLINENITNKEDNQKLQNKINEIKKEINEITKENNKIKRNKIN